MTAERSLYVNRKLLIFNDAEDERGGHGAFLPLAEDEDCAGE